MIDLFGKKVSILQATDPTLVGVKGTIMLESMKMLYLSTPTGVISFQKKGSVLGVDGIDILVNCDSIRGRPEDRLTRRGRR